MTEKSKKLWGRKMRADGKISIEERWKFVAEDMTRRGKGKGR